MLTFAGRWRRPLLLARAQVVCQGTQAGELRIRVASFECLHEIAGLYYAKLVPYMTEIYNITVKAIKEDEEDVALQVRAR